MNSLEKTRFSSQFQSAKVKISTSQFLFEQVLNPSLLRVLIKKHGIDFRIRFFCPITTLWVFLTQILNQDRSCRAAVAYFLSTLKSKLCSLGTGAYCQARKRLKESFLQELFLLQSQQLQAAVPPSWLWKGRRIKLVDGTIVSMPDTADNQLHFPASNREKNPVEFPLARIVVVICKTTGVLVNAAIGTYQGKGSGETSLLKELLSSFKPEDLVIFDRYYAGFFTLARLMVRGIDAVTRQHHLRKATLVKRLGKNDHLFKVKKPQRPKDMSVKEYDSLPMEILLRRIKIVIEQSGFRVKKLELITSLIDETFLTTNIAELYRYRWFVEVDIRSIKSAMGMDVLRCKTAEMIRKEIFANLLAYNLVRTVMIDAAKINGSKPRALSFKATLQLIFSFRNQMALSSGAAWSKLYFNILAQLKGQRVGQRPDRYEPRAKKRRPPPNLLYLRVSRQQARQNCLKRVS